MSLHGLQSKVYKPLQNKLPNLATRIQDMWSPKKSTGVSAIDSTVHDLDELLQSLHRLLPHVIDQHHPGAGILVRAKSLPLSSLSNKLFKASNFDKR